MAANVAIILQGFNVYEAAARLVQTINRPEVRCATSEYHGTLLVALPGDTVDKIIDRYYEDLTTRQRVRK